MLERTGLRFLAKNAPRTFCGAKIMVCTHTCSTFEYTCLFVAYCDFTATNPTKIITLRSIGRLKKCSQLFLLLSSLAFGDKPISNCLYEFTLLLPVLQRHEKNSAGLLAENSSIYPLQCRKLKLNWSTRKSQSKTKENGKQVRRK